MSIDIKLLKPGDCLGKQIKISLEENFSASGSPAGAFISIFGKIGNDNWCLSLVHIQAPIQCLNLILTKEINGTYEEQYNQAINNYETILDISEGKFIVTEEPIIYQETFLTTYIYSIEVKPALLGILHRIINKIDILSYKTDRILTRFTTKYDVLASATEGSGFSKTEYYAAVIGGSIYQRMNTTKSSNWGTGNITNTVIINAVIKKTNYNSDYPEETMAGTDWGYNIQGVTGNNGGLKAYYTSNNGTTRSYYITAVETADTGAKITQIGTTCYEQV